MRHGLLALFTFSLFISLSACADRSLVPSQPSDPPVVASATATPQALTIPEVTKSQPWGIVASNQDLAVDICLMDPSSTTYDDLGTSDLVTTGSTGYIEIYLDANLSFSTDNYSRIHYLSLQSGWAVLGVSVGDPRDTLISVLGDPDCESGSSFTYYVDIMGHSIDLSDPAYTDQLSLYQDDALSDLETTCAIKGAFADAMITYYIQDGTVESVTMMAVNQLPIPILVAPGICEIYSCTSSQPNSAGGVDVSISFRNLSEQAIKYITFSVTPYNAVGDQVTSEIGNRSVVPLKATGPIGPAVIKGDFTSVSWDTIWYNNTITNCAISSVQIEYDSGEIIDLPVT